MRITVYAGSALGNRPIYREATERFTREVVRAGHEIVYGGGAVGLMGVVADTALAEGGRVTGVMPRSLVDAEVAHRRLTELHVVDSMHERKQLMADLGDCFVALPGGVGTVEEILEVWAWLVLGHHQKPVTLLNVGGYWDRLVRMSQRMAMSGFLRPEEEGSLLPIANSAELFTALGQWKPPPPRWG
ncbi:TIGR00730 family Rossman fold protein [Streptomyces sp. ISL-22]|uniref:LOG family protein n=1 Tax=unclassified Streptomyces TaxID=2593676 RepID=UPI001BEB04AF|nr:MULTISPECIES: TIGR00730 family Rossman fold protein [unclassified Streptomyces]MBT2423891.1 TIGR00730 family Rossman fold protein [Streptomyces sp. ISL-24]MBT2437527.1 TIGR00730 family Rossman fold protein [Streptomyces sp. ISL-22]